MNQQAIISAVFNPQVIKDNLDLAQEVGLGQSIANFPFKSAEWAPLTWHLHIVNVACAAYFLDGNRNWLVEELSRQINLQEESVRIGDYVNANPDISRIRCLLGSRGWLFPIVNRQVPLRMISASVIDFKLDLFVSVFEKIMREGSLIEWQNYKDISDIYALSILGSYWGRLPDEQQDQSFWEPISEIIYENIYAIKEQINQ